MEEYLKILKKQIFDKKLEQFAVFPDLQTFKIVKKDEEEIVELMKKNPKKYAGRKVAIILFQFTPDGFKKNENIFSIGIDVYLIEKDGSLTENPNNIASLYLKYRADELEKHPFKIKMLEKLVKLVKDRYIGSNFIGTYYTEFEKQLAELKKIYIKKANRIKSKKTSKKTKRSIKVKLSKKSNKKKSRKY